MVVGFLEGFSLQGKVSKMPGIYRSMWALVGRGGRVEGKGGNDSCSMFGEKLGKVGVQREQDGREIPWYDE